jgi:hypothetical protein
VAYETVRFMKRISEEGLRPEVVESICETMQGFVLGRGVCVPRKGDLLDWLSPYLGVRVKTRKRALHQSHIGMA